MCEQLIEIKQVSNKKRLSYYVSVYYSVIYTFSIKRMYCGMYGGMNVVLHIFAGRNTCFTEFIILYR